MSNKHNVFKVISKDDIASVCYLNEALYYIACSVIPIKIDFNGDDIRYYRLTEYGFEDKEIVAEFERLNEFQADVEYTLVNYFNLPPNPFLDKDNAHSINNTRDYFALTTSERNLEKYLKGDKFNNTSSFWNSQNRLFIKEFIEQVEYWQAEHDEVVNKAKRRLIVYFKNNEIKVYGVIKDGKKADDEDYSYHLFEGLEVAEIKNIDWSKVVIDFEGSKIYQDSIVFENILLDFSDVIKCTEDDLQSSNASVRCIMKNGQMVIVDDRVMLTPKERASKGGKMSYKNNKPLQTQAIEIAIELESKRKSPFPSIRQLCIAVCKVLEDKHLVLLNQYPPYVRESEDWGRGIRGWLVASNLIKTQKAITK